MLAFATSPYIITTWIGGPMADAFMKGPGWMIQNQTAQGKEPQEKEEEQPGIEMQLAVPAFEDRP